MEFKIEKNVPLPPVDGNRNTLAGYLRKLGINESFFVECDKESQRRKYLSISSSKYTIGRELKRKFIIRSVEGGIRIWRTK